MEEEKREIKQEFAVEEKAHKKNIRKRLLLIPTALLLFIIAFWIFRETGVVVKYESDKMRNPAELLGGYIDCLAEQKGVSFDNLLFLASLRLRNGDEEILNDTYLCIFNTGDIYSFEYYEDDGWNEFYTGNGRSEQGYDDGVWAKVQNVFYFGRLPADETRLLNEYIDSFDPESEYYFGSELRRELSTGPYLGELYDNSNGDDEITVYQAVHVYWHEQPEWYGEKDALIEVGELICDQDGGYGKHRYLYSYDENAIAAIELFESSGFYDRWVKMCLNGY